MQRVVKRLVEKQTMRELSVGHDQFNHRAKEAANDELADAGCECIGFEVLQVEPVGRISELASKPVGFTIG